jgi:hypothetical protein
MNEKMLEQMKQDVEVQGTDGNWNYDNYMLGMYNGMVLMLSIAMNCEPAYRECKEEDFLYHKQDKQKSIIS